MREFVFSLKCTVSITFIKSNISPALGITSGFHRLTLDDWSTTTHTSSSPLLTFHPPSQPNRTQPPVLYNQAIVHFVLALPATFQEMLKNQEKKEGETATLCCKLSKPVDGVQWKKGSEVLRAGKKYEMKLEEIRCELQIKNLEVEDNGEYSCVCGDQKTSATLKVNGMDS